MKYNRDIEAIAMIIRYLYDHYEKLWRDYFNGKYLKQYYDLIKNLAKITLEKG